MAAGYRNPIASSAIKPASRDSGRLRGMAWHGDGAGKGIFPKGEVEGSPDDKPTKTDGPSGLGLPEETREPRPRDGRVLAQQTPRDTSGTAVTSGEAAWSIATSAGAGGELEGGHGEHPPEPGAGACPSTVTLDQSRDLTGNA